MKSLLLVSLLSIGISTINISYAATEATETPNVQSQQKEQERSLSSETIQTPKVSDNKTTNSYYEEDTTPRRPPHHRGNLDNRN